MFSLQISMTETELMELDLLSVAWSKWIVKTHECIKVKGVADDPRNQVWRGEGHSIYLFLGKANESYFKIHESLCYWSGPLLGNL